MSRPKDELENSLALLSRRVKNLETYLHGSNGSDGVRITLARLEENVNNYKESVDSLVKEIKTRDDRAYKRANIAIGAAVSAAVPGLIGFARLVMLVFGG